VLAEIGAVTRDRLKVGSRREIVDRLALLARERTIGAGGKGAHETLNQFQLVDFPARRLWRPPEFWPSELLFLRMESAPATTRHERWW
jgi:hypothetical protein